MTDVPLSENVNKVAKDVKNWVTDKADMVYNVLATSALDKAPRLVMSNGKQIPILGIGTMNMGDVSTVTQLIKYAIEIGYRHIDTALLYDTEKGVGNAVRDMINSGIITRDDIFITSKVWNTFHSRSKVMEGVKLSLSNLGLDYVDLMLMHWPTGYVEDTNEWFPKDKDGYCIDSGVDYLETWKGLEDAHKEGLVKSIGVSNFNAQQLHRLMNNAEIKPVMNQIESHPYLTEDELIKYCHDNAVLVTAYSPCGIANTALMANQVLNEIGKSHGKTAAQIAIKYQLQRNVIAIPKSSSREHIYENFNVFDFGLNIDEMNKIANLNKNERFVRMECNKNHQYNPFKTNLSPMEFVKCILTGHH